MNSSPYSNAKPEILAEITRLAEARLAAQLTLGVAADQRAMTFASFAAAIDAALIAAGVSLHHFSWAVGALTLGFGVSALLAVMAAQPVAWAIPGWRPAHWLDDIATGKSLHDNQAEIVGFYEKALVDNDKTMGDNANLLRGALVAVVASLIVGGVIALIWG